MTTAACDSPPRNAPLASWEWIALGGLLLIAVALRFSFPGRLAVEHFDEGVYASNIWFGDRPDGVYPAQHLYAPPLLPALIEWGFVFCGPSNVAAMWPSQVAGTVSVLLLWWLGRSWFGPIAGLVAAALCATSEIQVLLSRSALTDALLGMWWLAAIWALRRACDTGRLTDRLAAGLLVGAAWYTKYNGWMPLGIATGAVLLRGAVCRGIWIQTRTALLSCLIAGVLAFAVWSPWLSSLQSQGGYASVAANHRQYLVGITGWISSALRQNAQLTALFGPVSEAGISACYFMLLICFWIKAARHSSPLSVSSPAGNDRLLEKHFQPISSSVAMSGIYFNWLVSLFWPVLGISGLVIQGLALWSWPSKSSPSAPPGATRTSLGHWILLVWFGGLLVATPLYSPYLRLTLPWMLAGCLGVGLSFQQGWQAMCLGVSARPLTRAMKFAFGNQLFLIVAIYVLISSQQTMNPPHRTLGESVLRSIADQSRLPAAAREMAVQIADRPSDLKGEESPSVVYVYAEPSLLFQLRIAGLQNVAPVSSLQFAQQQQQFPNAQQRVFLVIGIHALNDSQFRDQFAAARGQFRRVGRWPWQPGPLVALDQANSVPKLLGHDLAKTAAIELYEVLPP